MGMFRTEGLLPDGQRALEEQFGLRILALGSVYFRKVVQARGHVEMIRAERSFPPCQRLPGKWNGLLVIALAIKIPDLLVKGIEILRGLSENCLEQRRKDQAERSERQAKWLHGFLETVPAILPLGERLLNLSHLPGIVRIKGQA